MTLESTFRQPIRRFTVSRTPPFRLSFHLCVSRCTGARVSVPCGIFRGTCPSGWSRERSAPSSVARVCLLTPLCTRTTPCRLSLLHHRGRWVTSQISNHVGLYFGVTGGVGMDPEPPYRSRHRRGRVLIEPTLQITTPARAVVYLSSQPYRSRHRRGLVYIVQATPRWVRHGHARRRLSQPCYRQRRRNSSQESTSYGQIQASPSDLHQALPKGDAPRTPQACAASARPEM